MVPQGGVRVERTNLVKVRWIGIRPRGEGERDRVRQLDFGGARKSFWTCGHWSLGTRDRARGDEEADVDGVPSESES
jgi:hypothetical protein